LQFHRESKLDENGKEILGDPTLRII